MLAKLNFRKEILVVLLLITSCSLIIMTYFMNNNLAFSRNDAESDILEIKQSKQYVESASTNSAELNVDSQLDSTTVQMQANSNRKIFLGFAVEPITAERISRNVESLDKEFSIVMMYKQWGNQDYSQIDINTLNMLANNSKVPLISWEPWKPGNGVNQEEYRLINIIDGKFDDYIRESARNIKNFEKPVFIRFAHEMNGNWYPWGGTVNGNTSEQYIQAWRHVFNIFSSEGVNNVTWVWSPDTNSYPPIRGNDLTDYYPGESYVDWIGLDGYNWGPNTPGKRWDSFSEVFRQGYDKATSLSNKPIMIAEFGSSETGGDKAEWIRDALEVQIPNNFERIKAIIWFDINRDNSWPIDSGEKTLEQFKKSLSGDQYITIPIPNQSKITPP